MILLKTYPQGNDIFCPFLFIFYIIFFKVFNTNAATSSQKKCSLFPKREKKISQDKIIKKSRDKSKGTRATIAMVTLKMSTI